MSTGEHGQADGVRVLLDRRLDDLFRGLVEAGVDDLHAGVAQRPRDDLGTPVVAVETRLGYHHPDGAGRSTHDRTSLSQLTHGSPGAPPATDAL